MAFSEDTGHYVGVGNTEKERLLDADLQDVIDDMAKEHLLDFAAYLTDMAEYIGDMSREDEPHDRPEHVAARTKLGRLMAWQGWNPASYYAGEVRGA